MRVDINSGKHLLEIVAVIWSHCARQCCMKEDQQFHLLDPLFFVYLFIYSDN